MIRLMETGDIQKIAHIEDKTFGTPWSEKILEENLENELYSCYVLEDGPDMCGYICFMAVAGEIELLRIAVDEKFRRMGLADILMHTMIDWAGENDIYAMTLEVRSKNVPAIRLYEKYGFKTEGLRKNYYHNPEDDALIMWCQLPLKNK